MPEKTPPHTAHFDLCAAFSAVPPGPITSPGPQAQDWSAYSSVPTPGPWPDVLDSNVVPISTPRRRPTGRAPQELVEWFGALAHHLFFSEKFHRDEQSGRALRVRRRPIPSAGAAYPVQLHLRLAHWRLAYHQEHDTVHDLTSVLPSCTCSPALLGGQVRLTFTVLPGRSFSRYRHRAWTLWIADAAYAVEGAGYALGHCVQTVPTCQTGPSELARQAGLPVGGLWPTPHRELAIQGLDVGCVVGDGVRLPELRPLPYRQSIPLKRLRIGTEPGPVPSAAGRSPHQQKLLAPENCSGQEWLACWPHVKLFTAPLTKDPWRLRRQLMDAHRRAARMTYAEAEAGRQVRPVSGFTDIPDRSERCLHALALEPLTIAGELS